MILIITRDSALAGGVQEGLRAAGIDAFIEAEVDATNMRAVRAVVADRRPQAVLHVAFLDDAVACEANTDRAFLTNAESVINLAAAAMEFSAVPVIWSPAQVLAGAGQRAEDDAPQPFSTWTESRIRGEVFLRRAAPRGLVLRSGPVLSPGLASEARRLLHGVTVGSALVVPTPAPWLGRVLARALEAEVSGTLHVPAAGPAKPEHEVWQSIAERVGRPRAAVRVDPVAGAGNAVLQSTRSEVLEGLGPAPDWTAGLGWPAPREAASDGAPGAASEGQGDAAEPASGLGPSVLSETPAVWAWVLAPGPAQRWTPPAEVMVRAVTGKAFIEAGDEDFTARADRSTPSTREPRLVAGQAIRVTVPEPTVLVIIGVTDAAG